MGTQKPNPRTQRHPQRRGRGREETGGRAAGPRAGVRGAGAGGGTGGGNGGGGRGAAVAIERVGGGGRGTAVASVFEEGRVARGVFLDKSSDGVVEGRGAEPVAAKKRKGEGVTALAPIGVISSTSCLPHCKY